MKRVLAVAAAMAIPALVFGQAGGADLSKAKLKTPSTLNEKAPDTYKANFDTSKGAFVIEVHRDWAPLGADRFYNLVKNGYYDDCRFFRVIDGFMAQIGMNGNPAVQSAWTERAAAGRSRQAEQQEGLRHLRARGTEYAHDAVLHQLRRQRRRSTSRASRRLARSPQAWTSPRSCTAVTGTARRAARDRRRDRSRPRAMRT